MATAEIAGIPLTDIEHRSQLRRAVIASTVGTTIEWYDFLLYGQMAAIVFAKLYFPSSDPLTGTLQAFAVFAVGFAARPIGAAIFGHYGDRIGRKAALIATLLLTGLSTVLVGCVPSYEQIGVWGAVVMVILRFIQGIGVGGEWGGSVLLSMEWARTSKNHGLIAAWPQFGGPAGFFLANLAILAFSQLSGDQFLSWGWRVPFWLGLIMVAIGLWIRLGILETPIFQQVIAEERVARAPVVEVFKRQPKEVFSNRIRADGANGTHLRLHRFYLSVWHAGRPRLARLHPARAADRVVHVVLYDPALRLPVGSYRPQAGLYLWRGGDGALRVRLLRHVQYRDPGTDHRGDDDRVLFPRPDVGSAGGADRRSFHSALALQRGIDRLSTRGGVRRRAGADDRNGAARSDRVGLCDRAVHLCLRDRQHRRDSRVAKREGPGFRAGSHLGEFCASAVQSSPRCGTTGFASRLLPRVPAKVP